MPKSSELEILNAFCMRIGTNKHPSKRDLARLAATFGTRFAKAWETLQEGRVKKYVFLPSGRIVWVVVGRARDYLVMPAANFCPCADFFFRVMDNKIHLCYHLIAQKMAAALQQFDPIEEEDALYPALMEEWRRVE